MNKKFAVMIAFVALVALPVSAFAATYGYITTNGSLATVNANSAAEALTVATNIDAHSGVILMPQGTLPTASVAVVSPAISVKPVVATSTMTSSMMTGTSTMATSTPMMASSTAMIASSTLVISATSTATTTVK